MSVERQTTNFDFDIPALGGTYKTEMDANWDSLDSLLKTMTQETTHTTSGASPSLTVNNSGAGYGIQVGKLNVTTTFAASKMSHSSAIELLPSGVASSYGLSLDVSGSYLRMTTGQTNGFHLYDSVKIENDLDVLGNLNIALKIVSDVGMELYADDGYKLYPDYDGYPSKYMTITYSGGTGEFVIDSLSSILKLNSDDNMLFEANGAMAMLADSSMFLYPAYTSDSSMVLTLAKNSNEIKLLGSTGDSIGIESKDKLELRAYDKFYLYPDYDGYAAKYLEINYDNGGAGITLQTPVGCEMRINSQDYFLLEASSALSLISDSQVLIYPDYDADAAMYLAFQRNSSELRVISSASKTLGIESEDAINIRADNKMYIYPNYDGYSTKCLTIDYSGVISGISIYPSSSTNLGITALGSLILTSTGSAMYLESDDKVDIKADNKAYIYPDYDGYSSKYIEFDYDVVGGLEILSSGSDPLTFGAGGILYFNSGSYIYNYKPLLLHPQSAPGSPVTGAVYYDSSANKLKVYTGSGWETVTSS